MLISLFFLLDALPLTSGFGVLMPSPLISQSSLQMTYRKDLVTDLELPNLTGNTLEAIVGGNAEEGWIVEPCHLKELLPVASARKCQIYLAQVGNNPDQNEESSLAIVKLSANIGAIKWEASAYQLLNDVLSERDRSAFVHTFGMVQPSESTSNCAGLIMERGTDNLRFQIRKKGAFRGQKLKEGFYRVIKIVNALHKHNFVWTEIKAENFVVLYGQHTLLKGIDLESVVPVNHYLKAYSAEACPPEFPAQEIYRSLPKIKGTTNFDVWGLGMVLFEMATGKPLYEAGLQDIEYIRSELINIDATLERAHQKLRLGVPSGAREIVQACLAKDPNDRPSCEELLANPYFAGFEANSYADISVV